MRIDSGTTLGAYEIIERLGKGGMGEVYRARDTRLNREVAIKVLSVRAAEDPDALARFEREARAVAALSHPNILAIYDVGSDKGVAFAVMELLDGANLRNRLGGSAFSWRRALEIGVSIAEGLAAAHERGVVHRDLKPENVHLTRDGVVKILDFGLARMRTAVADRDRAESDTISLHTTPGTILGTVGYLPPELLRGEETDARCDLFSLGCVLYEMITGRGPFDAATAPETLSAILRDSPPALATAGSAVPLDVERIVMRCLEKDPDLRFQSARDLAFALRTQVSAPESAVVPRGAEPTRIVSLAVLPLRNLAGDPEQDFFADGMTETLIAYLSGIDGMRVASRSAAMRYKGAAKSLPQIAREMNVDTIVEGSVLRVGDRVRITVELVHAASDSNLWAQSYERDLEDVLSLQSDVAGAIAAEIQGKLEPDTKARLAAPRKLDPEAYEAYLKGRYYWSRRTEETVRRSIEFFHRAIEIEPTYALAYAGVADAFNILGFYYDMPPNDAFPRAKAAALRALEMDETLTYVHSLVGYTRLFNDWDWSAAEADFRRTLEHDPASADGYRYLANLLVARGRFDEAVEAIRAGCKADPLSLINGAATAWVHYFARDYDAAIAAGRATQEIDRTFALGRLYCGWPLLAAGRHDEAIGELEKATLSGGRVPFTEAFLAHALGVAGQRDRARGILTELLGQAGRRYVSQFLVALIHLGLGDHDATFECLDRAYDERAHGLVFLDVDPRFDAIRIDPRFESLRQRVGLGASPA